MEEKTKDIKLILMDVDGVLTDGRIILGEKEELKFFDIKDGMGITLAKKAGLKVGVITGRTSKAVEKRGKELKMDYVIQEKINKLEAVEEILKKEKLDYKNIAYIGDDIIDISLFRKVGFSATVNDAPEYIKSEVSYVANKNGGRGAVREIIEYILKNQGVLQLTIDKIIEAWSNDDCNYSPFTIHNFFPKFP
ncbi:MAG: HAD-IIIA family hydrolase [bacterium]